MIATSTMDLMFEDGGFLPEPLRNEYQELRIILLCLGLFDGMGRAVDITGTEMEWLYERIMELYAYNIELRRKYILFENKRQERYIKKKMKVRGK